MQLTTSGNSITSDLRAVVEARKEFDSLPNRDKILKRREEQTIIYKPSLGGPDTETSID